MPPRLLAVAGRVGPLVHVGGRERAPTGACTATESIREEGLRLDLLRVARERGSALLVAVLGLQLGFLTGPQSGLGAVWASCGRPSVARVG